MSTLTAARPRYSRVEQSLRILTAMREDAIDGERDRSITPSPVRSRGRVVRRPDLFGLCDSFDRDDA